MLQGEHSAILLIFIKLPFSIKTFVLSIFKWPVKKYCIWDIKSIANTFNLYYATISMKTFVLSIYKWPLKTGFTVLFLFSVLVWKS